ncbi:hypothetical protein SCA6_011079 [Theobroma cacao]
MEDPVQVHEVQEHNGINNSVKEMELTELMHVGRDKRTTVREANNECHAHSEEERASNVTMRNNKKKKCQQKPIGRVEKSSQQLLESAQIQEGQKLILNTVKGSGENCTRDCQNQMDKLLSMRNTEFVAPIGSVGVLEPAIGLLVHKSVQAEAGEKIKGVPIEPSVQATVFQSGGGRQFSKKEQRGQNVSIDMLEGSGEYCPINEQGANEMQVST